MSSHTHTARFFELSLDLLCIAGTDGYFKQLSPSFTHTLGWSAEEMLARPFLDFVHPDDRAATLREVEKLAAGQPLLHFENRYQCKNGSWKTVAWRCNPQPDGTLYATGRDVTELKVTAAALQASEANLATTLDSIGDGVLATDAQRRITRLNPVAERLTGWTQAEALGRPVEEVLRIINEQTRQPAVVPVDDVLATGAIHGLANHTALIARDGTERSIADSAAPIRDGTGRISGVVLVFRDVTMESRLSTALRASEAYNRGIVESSPDCLKLLSLDARLLYMAPAGCRIMEVDDFCTLENADWLTFWKGDELTAAQRAVEAARAGGTGRFRGFCPTVKGSPRWWDVAITPILGADGKPVKLLCVSRDITESKRAEEQIVQLNETLDQRVSERTAELERAVAELALAEESSRQSEARFRMLVESVKDYSIIMLDVGGHIVSWNAGAERIKGYLADEIIGQHFSKFYPKEDVERGKPERELVVATSEGRFEEEAWRVRKDGSRFMANVVITAVRDGTGKLRGFAKVTRDVTAHRQVEAALRESEERFRDLFENANDLIQSVRMDGSFLYVNRAWRETLGYSEAEVSSLTLKDILHPSSLGHCMKQFQRVISGETLPRVEAAFLTKGGREIMVEGNSSCQFADGQPVATRSIFRDITERMKSEKNERRAQRLESIGTLAGGVAHDLNNALAPILMVTELLRMEYPARTELIDTVEASAKRGADMVRQLLTFAKGVEGERLLIQPLHLLKEMEKIIKGSFPKNIRLRTNYGRNLRTVLGDSTQLHQVLVNLCVNARDAMPEGGTLTLEAENTDVDSAYVTSVPEARPGPYVVWRISDTGTGIPPEVLDRIFEPFFSTKGPDKGTGLGLSTVLGIIKSHGGYIRVYSVPGQGTTFTVHLPASEEDAGHTAFVAKSGNGFRGNGETVLIVDDEQGIREVCRRVLTELNFKVLTASDGTEALIQVADHRADLRAVITDVHMPHMDGLTLVRLLKRMLPQAGLIVTSGRMDEREEHEFKSLGVAALLDKPFTQQALLEALKSVFVK